jgi:CheY-like chemotaxis protein
MPTAAIAGTQVGAAASAGDIARSRKQGLATILYVEDNAANRLLIEHVVARHAHARLLTAATAEEGLQIAQARHPDLILLDIQLPDHDGYTVLAQLQANASTRDIPVVAVSAYAMPDDRRRAGQAGFVDYIAKPIDVAQFDAMLERLLSKRD